MKKYIETIEKWGIILLIVSFCITTLWGKNHAFFPMLFTIILLAIDVAYKAFHWNEYLKENKRNMYLLLVLLVFLFMNTVFGM